MVPAELIVTIVTMSLNTDSGTLSLSHTHSGFGRWSLARNALTVARSGILAPNCHRLVVTVARAAGAPAGHLSRRQAARRLGIGSATLGRLLAAEDAGVSGGTADVR